MNQHIFDLNRLFPGTEASLRTRFETAVPYPHAVLHEVIAVGFARRLYAFLESLPYQWRRVHESFYEHEVCNLLQLTHYVGGALKELCDVLQDPLLVARLCRVVGSPAARLMGFTGHRLYHGDRIDTHNDYNTAGEVFRLLMFIDPEPRFSGGELLLQEEVAGEMVTRARVPYKPFQVYLFRFGAQAHHAVTPVEAHQSGANRLTLLATYGLEDS